MAILKFWGTSGGYPTSRQMTCLQITSEKANLMIDMGSSGIFKYPSVIDNVSTILLTHLHSDHVLMLPHFFVARMRIQGSAYRRDNCPVYAPQSISNLMASGALSPDWVPWSDEVPDQIGDIKITTMRTQHTLPCYAYKLQVGGKTVVITGDTRWFEGLAEFAEGADWFICECNTSDQCREHAEMFCHMTPGDVARVISLAKPRHTVLYHFDMLSPQASVQAVREHLDNGQIVIASQDEMELKLA